MGDINYILLMSRTGAGKTRFINEATNSKLKVGHDMSSCTTEVRHSEPINVDGRKFVLIDTPGLDNSEMSDDQILKKIQACVLRKGLKVVAAIYVHDITQVGSPTSRSITKFKQAVRSYNFDKLTVITTRWGIADPQDEEEHFKALFKTFTEKPVKIFKWKPLSNTDSKTSSQSAWDEMGFTSPADIINAAIEGSSSTQEPAFISPSNQTNVETDREEFILVMGARGSGKTSFINAASRSALKVGHGTSEIGFSDPFLVNGCKTILFDMPSFDATNRSNSGIFLELGVFLSEFYGQKRKLVGVLYLHDISNDRMNDTTVRDVQMFNDVVGEDAAPNIVIVTTKWDLVDPETGRKRQEKLASDPRFFGHIISKGATIRQYAEGDDPVKIIEKIIRDHKRINLQIVEQLGTGMKLSETAAGRVLSRDLGEAIKKHQEDMDMDRDRDRDMGMGMDKLTKTTGPSNSTKRQTSNSQSQQREIDITLEEAKNTPTGKRVRDLLGAMWKKIKDLFS